MSERRRIQQGRPNFGEDIPEGMAQCWHCAEMFPEDELIELPESEYGRMDYRCAPCVGLNITAHFEEIDPTTPGWREVVLRMWQEAQSRFPY